ncbi:MAG: S8 family serine peptidase [Tannerella sp.]|jgi:subtilisin family serine protease|nr:S8 family serine peptidase [Tannerella sp.]
MNRVLLLTVSLLLLSHYFCFAQVTAENDTLFFKQKALFEKLGVFKAWETTQGSPDVFIGCVDNGFDFYHPYLHDQLIPGYYVDGAYHPMTFTTMSHGTLVSSLMVAKSKNENGMHGLAPDCKVLTASIGSIEHIFRRRQEIMKDNPDMSMQDVMMEIDKDSLAVRQFADRWNTYAGESIAKSIIYLVRNNVKVINISSEIIAVYPEQTQRKIDDAFDYARQQDVLLVIAAGNSNKEIPNTLKHRDHVIMVGALSRDDTRWMMTAGNITQGSNWGELLDVCAPVEELVVCMPSDERYYNSDDGPMGAEHIPHKAGICDVMPYGATSSAAPIVTSLAALVYSIAPDMTADEVKKVILESCDDIGDEGVDVYTGHGRINFGKTITSVMNRSKSE